MFGAIVSTSFGASSTQRLGLVDGNTTLVSYPNAPNTMVANNSHTTWVRVALPTLTPITQRNLLELL